MPVVPNTLAVESVYCGRTNETTDERNNRFNYHQNSSFESDFVADVSEEQIEEITRTLRVNMVSEPLNNINDLSSSSSNTFSRDSTHFNTITNNNNNPFICGVIFVDERLGIRNSQHNEFSDPLYKNYIILGSVVLNTVDILAEELRRYIQTQLSPVIDTTQRFTFLTKQGWPVLRNQENKINASNLINSNNVIAIRKAFDKPRLGITNSKGESFGFIFAEYYWSLRQLRDTIDEQLKEIGVKNRSDYIFIEKNGWPVATNQELILTVIDIVVNGCVCLQSGSLFVANDIQSSNAITEPQYYALPPIKYGTSDEILNSTVEKTQDLTDSMVPERTWGKKQSKKGFSVSIRQTTRRRNEKTVKIKSGKSSEKPIMLSYARQEAAKHALDLKEQLVNLGFSVYLDVHEIQTGSDWQDSLNDAVRGCHVFVPLVTPMYGKTQWTNREVKLADLLRKHIIPVNFLDTWPPECLAIQFATTQYISWRPPESEHETQIEKSIMDIKIWPQPCLEIVSKQIAQHINTKLPKSEPIMAALSAITETDGPKATESDKPLIVISAHPSQKTIVAQITSLLSDDYNVWCSTDLPEGGLCDEDISNSPPFTPNHLKTIPEDIETSSNDQFNSNYAEYARRIVESSKQIQRPKSLPPGAANQIFELKKPLTRMMSQNSETSHLSSISPDKMDRLKAFQEKVISATVVIILVSDSYFNSRTSQQHVYYCEHRKKTILVQCDSSVFPAWFSMFPMSQDFTIQVKSPRFNELLKSRVRRTLDPSFKAPADAMHESKMQYLALFMKKNLPLLETCVYVVGSIKLQNPRSERICEAIGLELAKVKNVTVVTSGFYGAGDIVASSFSDFRKVNPVSNSNNESQLICPNSFESSVVHIVPLKDSEDYSKKCRQNSDGSFEIVPYGKTVFLGESVKERESAVARILDTCIIVEGGPGAAHEIEEFIWNDHFVIPVISSGGAASGKYGVPSKIFDCPNGVSECDWAKLASPDETPLEVAKAIVRIIVGLKKAIATHALSKLSMQMKVKSKLLRSRSGKKKLAERRKVNISAVNAVSINNINDGEPESPEKMLPVIESVIDNSKNEKSKPSKWKKMHRLITFSKTC